MAELPHFAFPFARNATPVRVGTLSMVYASAVSYQAWFARRSLTATPIRVG